MTADILERLVVWSDQRIAGELSIDRGGAMHFTYTEEWMADIVLKIQATRDGLSR